MRNKSFLNRKGQIQSLTPAVLGLMFAAIVLILGLVITQSIRDTSVVTSENITYDAINKTIAGLTTFADFWEIIVLAVVIGIVIGLLLVVFGGGRSGR